MSTFVLPAHCVGDTPATQCYRRRMMFRFIPLIVLCGTVLSQSVCAEPLTVVSIDTAPSAHNGGGGEYVVTIRFANTADEQDASPYVVADLPPGTRYVEGSATGPGAVTQTLTAPLTASARSLASGADSPELPSDSVVRGIRWNLPGPMDPGVRGIVSFRYVRDALPTVEGGQTDPGKEVTAD